MGTSTHNSGQKGNTPLVPSWLDEDGGKETNTVLPQIENPRRFIMPRSNFTRYVGSGGGNSGALRRSISEYVNKSLGGSRNATVRLGSARHSASSLFGFFNALANGVSNAGREYQLSDLVGRPADEVFRDIAGFVCPDGGTTDEGIARSSYFDALIDMPELAQTNIENLTVNQMSSFLQMYMENVIMERLINDIGNKVISLPEDVAKVDHIQEQIKGFIKGDIADAFANLGVSSKIGKIDEHQTQQIVDSVYESAYSVMEVMGDE